MAQLALLSEIVKASSVPCDVLLKMIGDYAIEPRWLDMALPPGKAAFCGPAMPHLLHPSQAAHLETANPPSRNYALPIASRLYRMAQCSTTAPTMPFPPDRIPPQMHRSHEVSNHGLPTFHRASMPPTDPPSLAKRRRRANAADRPMQRSSRDAKRPPREGRLTHPPSRPNDPGRAR